MKKHIQKMNPGDKIVTRSRVISSTGRTSHLLDKKNTSKESEE